MTKNLFGTDGIRARIGSPPLMQDELVQLGNAIARWAQARYRYQKKITIICGQDTRASSCFVGTALQVGLLAQGIDITNAGVISTPALYYIQQKKGFDAGIMISASHNPYYDNGIKIIDTQLGKLSEHDEQLITQFFYEVPITPNYMTFGQVNYWPDAYTHYMQSVLQSLFPTPFLQNKKIVLDCAYGATSSIAPQIFRMLGAQVIALHTKPTGSNINEQCGSVYPQTAQAMILQEQADAGFAFDGDGDRMVAINRYGDLKNGDDALALLSQHPAYTGEHSVVGTIMSNQGLALFLAQQNKKLLRTPVGDKYIARQLLKEDLLLGGEQSGHIIVRDHLNAGDGIVTALRILEALTITNNWNMDTFTPFPQTLINVPITTKKDLTSPALNAIITQHEAQLGNGRIVVRYSGTEPLLRVMVEEQDQHIAHTVGNNLARALQQALHI